MLQCPAGELAMRVERRNAKNGNKYRNYVFDKNTCDKCPLKDGCRVGKGKSHSYSIISVPSEIQIFVDSSLTERISRFFG